jgi:hypothetical protein
MNEQLPDGPAFLARYARVWTVLIIIAAFALAVGFIAVRYLAALAPRYLDAFQAVGEAILASLILYILISLFIDPRRQLSQAHSLAGYAIHEANKQFQQRFEVSLPTAVYEASSFPKVDFRENFVALMTKSTRYDHCGTTAHFASFRLAAGQENPEVAQLDQVRLCIIDPRVENVIRAHCQLRLRNDAGGNRNARISEEIRRMKEEIYTTLVALFDISGHVSTSVYFHTNLPYFRCEMFDDGMFLTYYLGGARYPETLEFSASTRPYRAYKSAMLLVRRFATKTIQFGYPGSSADLIEDDDALVALLADLGCATSLGELRVKRDERFSELEEKLSAAGISKNDLF